MNWKQERDSLIAETMAFVQSVTGKRKEGSRLNSGFAAAPAVELPVLPARAFELSPAPDTVSPIEPVRIVETPPVMATPSQRPTAPGEMAAEIRARVASFRAHQERFNREREQYFKATLERLHAAVKDGPSPRYEK
jgi:hypothetical protein